MWKGKVDGKAKGQAKSQAKAKPLKKANIAKHDKEVGTETLDDKLAKLFKNNAKTPEDDKVSLIDGFLNKLDANAQMLLWKKFELSRKMDGAGLAFLEEELSHLISLCEGRSVCL